MDANLLFEIKAEAFRRMTGQTAPGKDPGMAGQPASSYEERCYMWAEWQATHIDIISALLEAVEELTPNRNIPTQAIIGSGVPSIEEMFFAIRKNYGLLNEADRNTFAFIVGVRTRADRVGIETISECRTQAWSMMNRYGITA